MDEAKLISMSFDDLIDASTTAPDLKEAELNVLLQEMYEQILESVAVENPLATPDELRAMADETMLHALKNASANVPDEVTDLDKS